MQNAVFDRYQIGESLIHHLDPRVKVVVTVLFVLSNALLPDGAWVAFGLSWCLVLVVVTMSRINTWYILKSSFVVIPFSLVAVTILASIPGTPLLAWHLGCWHLVVTDAGLVRFATIALRSWLSVQMAVLLAATTKVPDLMHALRHLGIPSILIAITSFMFRYLSVLVDEAVRLMRARSARSAGRQSGLSSIAWQGRVVGNMTGQLFLRSYERSERVYHAMAARGFQGQFVTVNPHRVRRRDWAMGGLAIVVLMLLQIIGHWPW